MTLINDYMLHILSKWLSVMDWNHYVVDDNDGFSILPYFHVTKAPLVSYFCTDTV